MECIRKLENWKEISKGYYYFAITPRCGYEIIIKFWNTTSDILTANADLYGVGNFSGESENFIKRELILNGPVCDCLEKAIDVTSLLFSQIY